MKRVVAVLLMGSVIFLPAVPAIADVCGWEAGGESGGETHTHESSTTSEPATTTAAASQDDEIMVGYGDVEDIPLTRHSDVKPVDECLDREETRLRAEELKMFGKFSTPIELWQYANGLWITPGNFGLEKYAASKLTGIPVRAKIVAKWAESAPGYFEVDWSNTWYCGENFPPENFTTN